MFCPSRLVRDVFYQVSQALNQAYHKFVRFLCGKIVAGSHALAHPAKRFSISVYSEQSLAPTAHHQESKDQTLHFPTKVKENSAGWTAAVGANQPFAALVLKISCGSIGLHLIAQVG